MSSDYNYLLTSECLINLRIYVTRLKIIGILNYYFLIRNRQQKQEFLAEHIIYIQGHRATVIEGQVVHGWDLV